MNIRGLARFYRRLISRYFRGLKGFLVFLAALLLAAYFIQKYGFSRRYYLGQAKSYDTNSSTTILTSAQEHQCGVKQTCPAGKYPYHVKSGYLEDGAASICFRGKYYIEAGALHGRGINVVVINENTLEVEKAEHFDTFESDVDFKSFIAPENMSDYRVVLMASEDEMTSGLTQETVDLIHGYGSDVIHKVRFRENFVMVGQKGLTRGTAIEKHMPSNVNRPFGAMVELSGCLSVPVGRVFSKYHEELKKVDNAEVYCGVTTDCGSKAIPVRLYSGFEDRIKPRICVNGVYVLDDVAGRGINVVIIDPATKSVIKSARFDTFETKSEQFLPFLRSMKEGDLIIALTHDEATKMLDAEVKAEFELLGSSYIKRLTVRDSWGFVGRKGIKGRSTIEELEFAPTGGMSWSNSIDKKVCVPLEMKGFSMMFEAVLGKNVKRDTFCSHFFGYGDFCSSENRVEKLEPAPLLDHMLENARIFDVPILVIAGKNKLAFQKQLEALLALPGIRPSVVKMIKMAKLCRNKMRIRRSLGFGVHRQIGCNQYVTNMTGPIEVFYDQSVGEYHEFASLFGFNAVPVDQVTNTNDLIRYALEHGWVNTSDYVILFEDELIPTIDFLSFMNQCLNVIDADNTLIGASAWNDNGFVETASNATLAYRMETFPGMGFMLRKSFYDTYMRNDWSNCCVKRTWEGWMDELPSKMEMIVPDVSRVVHLPYEGVGNSAGFLEHFLNRPRVFNKYESSRILKIESLSAIVYEINLQSAIRSAVVINITDVSRCLAADSVELQLLSNTKGKVYAIYYEQESISDEDTLFELCKCFKLLSFPGYPVRGKHRGLVRFSRRGNQVFLIGSASDYYSLMPNSHKPLKKRQS